MASSISLLLQEERGAESTPAGGLLDVLPAHPLRPVASDTTRAISTIGAVKWTYGGGPERLHEGLTIENMPDLTGSGASAELAQAWVCTIQAVQDMTGALRSGSCFLLNHSAAPLVEIILGERVERCAGFAAFFTKKAKFECGFRYAPRKWDNWIDRHAADGLRPLQDIHAWLETRTHYIDFSIFEGIGDGERWPPLLCMPKSDMPRHPREAGGRQSVLTWRSPVALQAVEENVGAMTAMIGARALQIFAATATARSVDRRRPPASSTGKTDLVYGGGCGGPAAEDERKLAKMGDAH